MVVIPKEFSILLLITFIIFYNLILVNEMSNLHFIDFMY